MDLRPHIEKFARRFAEIESALSDSRVFDNPQRLLFPGVGTDDGEYPVYQPDAAPGTNERDVPSLWAGPLSTYFAE